jgi:hypothetical protein
MYSDIRIYIGLFFRKVVYISYDASWFVLDGLCTWSDDLEGVNCASVDVLFLHRWIYFLLPRLSNGLLWRMCRGWFLTTVDSGLLAKVATKRCKINSHFITIFWVHLVRGLQFGLLYQPRMMMNVEQSVEWELSGKPKYSGKTRTSTTLFTTGPTWPDLWSNPDRRGGKPAANPHGALVHCVQMLRLNFDVVEASDRNVY